ncbi:hypothetical protein NRB16_07445 [Pseudomonas sp. LJDD11]|uniref:hypothetical protein n=1 Tax=Pseudomonas sp. LJDD11 TaxID=2931984 RepID=UPI00211B95C3|nr:hypothetical protein [Pseudomonas sp. LJDD11]MCQ9423356.1 hypothetical protein [Pseudomonas sp. LJDD11]
MKTNSTLRLGRIKYRKLAEQAKLVGCCLAVSSYWNMGCWGLFSPFVQTVHADATTDHPDLSEQIVIQLSATVEAGALRAVTRPEIDWGALEDHEIFDFIVAHEIGHRVDNYGVFDLHRIKDVEALEKCRSTIRAVNEVLADRYAWSQVRPGEPVPLSENGKLLQEQVAEAMVLLDQHVPRPQRVYRSLPGGQYAWVPEAMLFTDQLTAYVGPRTSPTLIERARHSRRVYRRDTRGRAYP